MKEIPFNLEIALKSKKTEYKKSISPQEKTRLARKKRRKS